MKISKDHIKSEIIHAYERSLQAQPTQTPSSTTKNMSKKIFKPKQNFFQKRRVWRQEMQISVLNFYNMLSINEEAISNMNYHQCFMKTLFYCQCLRRIESTDKYITIYLSSIHTTPSEVAQTLDRYKTSQNKQLRELGYILESLEEKIKQIKASEPNRHFLSEQTQQLLNNFHNTPFLCKISNKKLVVSRTFIELFGYEVEDFILELMNYKVPLFEGFNSETYTQLVLRQAKNLLLLMDFLQGTIPLATCLEQSSLTHQGVINAKGNIKHLCKFRISMPLPLVHLIEIQKIIETRHIPDLQPSSNMTLSSNSQLHEYCQQIRNNSYKTLQNLIPLQDNYLSVNDQRISIIIRQQEVNDVIYREDCQERVKFRRRLRN